MCLNLFRSTKCWGETNFLPFPLPTTSPKTISRRSCGRLFFKTRWVLPPWAGFSAGGRTPTASPRVSTASCSEEIFTTTLRESKRRQGKQWSTVITTPRPRMDWKDLKFRERSSRQLEIVVSSRSWRRCRALLCCRSGSDRSGNRRWARSSASSLSVQNCPKRSDLAVSLRAGPRRQPCGRRRKCEARQF